MPIDDRELFEMISRVIPEDLPEDPEISYKPRPERESSSDRSRCTPSTAAVPQSLTQTRVLPRLDVARSGESAADAERQVSYVLRNKVARGGFGEVWEAVQACLGRLVAVKRLRADHLEEAAEIPHESTRLEDDFRREALTTALLEHPNIVPVHDLGVDEEGLPLLAMKMVNGERWDLSLKAEYDSMPFVEYLERQLPIFLDMCQAVAFAHSRGVVHRDLKPSQVMVGEFGEVLLMDWGLAVIYEPSLVQERFQDVLEGLVPTLEEAYNPTGTAAFMAPEQTLDTAMQIGPWTDTYLLGGTLYYILTRRAPHSCGDAMEAFRHAAEEEVEPPQGRSERELPPELCDICMKALSRDISERYASVRDLMAAVQDFITGAGRRRESVRLTGMARALEPDTTQSYERLNECNNLLSQALALYPRNPEAGTLQQTVRRRFAELALRNDDLVLARLMADSVVDTEERNELRREIQNRENAAQAGARQRVILRWVIALLIAVIVADVIILTRWHFGTREELASRSEELREEVDEINAAARDLRTRLNAIGTAANAEGDAGAILSQIRGMVPPPEESAAEPPPEAVP